MPDQPDLSMNPYNGSQTKPAAARTHDNRSYRGRRQAADTHFRHSDLLGGLDILQARYDNYTFSRHTHETLTIGVIEDGAQGFYRSGADHIAPAGTIIMVNADDVHSGHSETQGGWAYRAMYPSLGQIASLNQQICRRHGAEAPYFPQAVIQDKDVASELYFLMSPQAATLSLLARESLLMDAWRKLIIRHARTKADEREPGKSENGLQRVKDFLQEFPHEDVALQQLAELAGLSPYYLTRSFKKAFGLPPHAYQIQVRLQQAQRLIKQGRDLVSAAQASGFHDQSHLHRHFRKALSITPGQFQRAYQTSHINR